MYMIHASYGDSMYKITADSLDRAQDVIYSLPRPIVAVVFDADGNVSLKIGLDDIEVA